MRSSIRILSVAALGLIATGYVAPASATITFTWNPSATGNTTAGTFSANRYGLGDWASIDTSNLSDVTDTGFLNITDFTLSGSPVSTVNTSGSGGYGIYLQFNATAHLTPVGSDLIGAFDSVSYTEYLYSTKNGLASFGFSGTTPTITLPSGANPVVLATGSGPIGGTANLADILDGVPGANVGTTFAPNSAEAGFFVNPSAAVTLNLEQAFTNTPGVITTMGPIFLIHGGGGNGDFFSSVPVPEPMALSILGVGLVSLGFVRRRRLR